MTIWKAGMLAVCVHMKPRCSNAYGGLERLKKGAIYRVTYVTRDFGEICLGFDSVRSDSPDGSFWAARFRPLNDAEQDESLIAKIKNCKPARTPQPVSSGAPLRARKATGGGYSHSSPVSGRSTSTQAGN